MQIVEAQTKKDIKDFALFPKRLYQDSPYWVPPLWGEEMSAYDGETNVMLKGNDHALLLAKDSNGEILGRTLVYIDNQFNQFYKAKTGFFGAFETVDDQVVASALLEASVEWLRSRQMEVMRGPIHPIAESWGFLIKGYDSLPVLMAPYNPPYYHTLMENFGLEKAMDLFAYEVDLDKGYTIPERIERFVTFFQTKNRHFTCRPIDVKNLVEEANHIWRISNSSLLDNWGYVPVDASVIEDMIKRLKDILDPNAVWFVEDKGRPVGYALGFPDPNPTIKAIKGKMFPLGFTKLLKVRSKETRYRLFALAVLPEYHGMGLDVLLYKNLHDALKGRLTLLEANYILEINWNIRNALEKLNMERTKEYRIYEMALS
ncbi:MAG: GNAT family N-acetyltransferase [Sphaerochaetaceae bacterium]|jgi:GNAT superfamily N-acetyltransferase|nr:GNAT family N-acetyltransferase [Sphaerochaetaceae bacterium]HHU87829.1 GNAT family N-acetyltransferase [Spirochaetales bacterium]